MYVELLTAQLECVSLEGEALMGESYLFYKNSQLSSFSDLSQYLSAFSYFKITAADSLVPDMQKEFEHS